MLVGEQTAHQKRYGQDFKGPCLPFGCHIEYQAITDDDKARLHKYGGKLLPGIFMYYESMFGGKWSGDVWIVDWEAMENAENVHDVPSSVSSPQKFTQF